MSLLRQAVEASRVSKALEDLEKKFLIEGIRQRKITALHDVIKKGPQRIYHQAAELLVGQQNMELA